MFAALLTILGLVALYLWLRGRWPAGALFCVAWIVFAHTPTFLQVLFIIAFSFAPFMVRLGWRHRFAIRECLSLSASHTVSRSR